MMWPERAGGQGADSGALEPVVGPQVESYQTLFTILSALYLFLGVLMFICSWATPSINIGASVSFALISVIVVVAAVVQIIYRKELISYLCGQCPPASMLT
jgi:hypothetical protein